MNIEFDAYKQKLNDCRPALEGLADSLNLEGMRNELERLHAMQEAPGFWDDPDKSQKIVVKTRQIESKIEHYEKMLSDWDDLMTICEMAEEEDDDSMLEELKAGFAALTEAMESCRLETLLTGHYDKNNAMMSFQAGAGGTEAQDWCQMLYRMYTRWAERHGFTYKIMDYQEGDEAGLKSASIMIEGENAYGFLKGENGVHRLVRVSPFDANARRQTSFAAVEVIPDIENDSQDVEIRPEDYDCLVPVPLHYDRQWTRGFNQAEVLARLIGARLGLPVNTELKRGVNTRKQARLRVSQRHENVKNAFYTKASYQGMRILIVDDVLTTGSTVCACAKALRKAGATDVAALTVAGSHIYRRRRKNFSIILRK